jgi:hypothetical protein
MFGKLIARLREPSSLAGLGALAVLAGAQVDAVNHVATAAGALLGVLAVLVPEGGGK